MDSKKKTILLSIIGSLIGILSVIGIGYAYYIAKIGVGSKTNVDLISDTSDKLTFNPGTNLSLRANQFNFDEGMGNLTSSSTSSATLVANSNTKTATAKYQAYFNIIENGYTYTKDTATPEIILTVTKPDGTELTSIDGLAYVTISDTLAGFDITTKKGPIKLAEDYAITSNDSTVGITQEWTVKITYRNLDVDQIANEGKTFNANVLLQKEKYKYTLAGMNASDVNNFVTKNPSAISTLVSENGIRFSGTYDEVENWICFGSTASTCPENNLYRIIGIFNLDGVYKYKLIKGDYATAADLGTPFSTEPRNSSYPGHTSQTTIATYQYDADNSNDWKTSDINSLLNGTYLTNIGSIWSNKISTSTYYVSGYSTPNATVSTFYNYESATSATTTWSGKVGLMYVSDYGYAAPSSFWNTNVNSYSSSAYLSDWLYNGGSDERTITPVLFDPRYVFYVIYDGNLHGNSASYEYAVRPVFYLNSSEVIAGGNGTKTSPYTLTA